MVDASRVMRRISTFNDIHIIHKVINKILQSRNESVIYGRDSIRADEKWGMGFE